jgi:hypothetical protein
VRLAGERIPVSSPLTTPLISAHKHSVAPSGLGDEVILASIAERRTAQMAIDLDRSLLRETRRRNGQELALNPDLPLSCVHARRPRNR